MAGTVFGFLIEPVQVLFLQLWAKLFYKSSAPRTFIGKHYLSQRNNSQRPGTSSNQVDQTRSLPPIRRLFDNGEAAWKTGFSVAYGPLYRNEESDKWREIKQQSSFRTATLPTLPLSCPIDNCHNNDWCEAIDKVKDKVQALYGDSIDCDIDTMILDSSFLLQVALLVLGGAKQLYLPPNAPLFGEDPRNRVAILRAAVSSMFVVGNQIPLGVLQAVMKQRSYKLVVSSGIWEQPMDLEKRVLFDLLLVPAAMDVSEDGGGARSIPTALLHDYGGIILKQTKQNEMWNVRRGMFSNTKESLGRAIEKIKSLGAIQKIKPLSVWFNMRKVHNSEKANDLLHGLWLLMTGSEAVDHAMKIDKDSEYHCKTDRVFDFILPTVPSATQLKELGIVFQYKEGMTIADIRFKKIMFGASLFLPQIVLDFDNKVDILLANLIKYEVAQFSERNWKVCEYIQLMRELIRSQEDVKIVAASGVIVVDPSQEAKVPDLFKNLDIPRVKSNLGPLGRVRNELIKYTRPSPFKNLRDVLTIVLLLTLIQTIFTVLPYFQKKQ